MPADETSTLGFPVRRRGGSRWGRLVINNSMSVNGAFEAPVPEPDGWLVLPIADRS